MYNFNTAPDVPQNAHTAAQGLFIESVSAVSCAITGVDLLGENYKCLGIDPKSGKLSYNVQNPGLVGFLGKMITVLYTPPASSTQYISYLQNHFGIPGARAQGLTQGQTGVGFQGLTPLVNIWVTFRNLVYLFFVIVFVLIGLGIMLRVKIDPRAVMTIENQIPKIVIGLLLVTFSFAIAGFLIDMMYVAIYLLINIFATADPKIIPTDALNNLNKIPFGFADSFFKPGGVLQVTTDAAGVIGSIVGTIIQSLLSQNNVLLNIFGFFSFCWVGNIIGLITGQNNLGCFIASGFVAAIATIIIYLAIVWSLLKLWFDLIKSYIFILMDVIFAPFYIAAGLIPGSPLSFGNWVRDLLANLSAFPVVIVMFMLARVFSDAVLGNQANMFIPPLIGNSIVGGNNTFIGSLITLGIILIMHDTVNIVKNILKAPEFKFATALGTSVAGGRALAGAAVGSSIGPVYKNLFREADSARGINAGYGTRQLSKFGWYRAWKGLKKQIPE